MLNPDSDRLDYGQLLAPPAGYHLDFAVGTTYSLDLDALVGASLALGLGEETDSSLMDNPVCLLEALRSTGGKVVLFCEDGQIHLPGKVTPLYILLEHSVFPVKTGKRSGIAGYPSFHPKFWLIRYEGAPKEYLYRVIVLSRNLTFDRSWDVAYSMDGTKVAHDTGKNRPVCDFLHYLENQLPDRGGGAEKRRGIRSLIHELPYIAFAPGEKEFWDYEFLPTGYKLRGREAPSILDTPLFSDTFHELLILSPFLSAGVLSEFNHRNDMSGIKDPRYVLFTRAASLAKLKPADLSNFQVYIMKDLVVDGEAAISGQGEDFSRQDIHAKVYMVRKYADTDLYLGSLNASHNAVYGNVEFMLRLRSKNRYLNLKQLMASLCCNDPGGADSPFQPVDLETLRLAEDVREESRSRLDNAIKALLRKGPTACVEKEEGSYALTVRFTDMKETAYEIMLRPLLCAKYQPVMTSNRFDGLTLTQLSEFYAISASDGLETVQRVAIIPTDGLPEERERAVITSIINNRACFYRYIAFLLGDNAIVSTLETQAVEAGAAAGKTAGAYDIPALYEKMLQTAATSKEKLQRIEYLMRTISEDGIIPESFRKLYETFRKAVKSNGPRGRSVGRD